MKITEAQLKFWPLLREFKPVTRENFYIGLAADARDIMPEFVDDLHDTDWGYRRSWNAPNGAVYGVSIGGGGHEPAAYFRPA